jgi:hypothetical protein
VLVGIMVWSAIVDGYPREGAVVGALACFGVVILLPVLGKTSIPFAPVPVLAILAVQVVVVVIGSRVAGLRTDAAPALLISAAAWAVAAGVLFVAGSRERPN